MKLSVVVDGLAVELTLERQGESVRFRLGDGEAKQSASVAEVEPGIYSVLWAGRSFEVKVVEGPGCLYVDTCNRHLATQVLDPRAARSRHRGPAGEGPLSIAAPMPGRVLRLLVSKGDRVEAGQGLIVVEAMKMQNEMKAPRAGTVAAVSTREGAGVSAGEPLITLE